MISELLLGSGGLLSLGSTIYFAIKYTSEVRHSAAVEVAQAHSEGEQTRLVFENETLRQQLELAERRADALQGVLADDVSNADLPDDDVRSRLLRFARETVARRQDDPGDAVVHQDTAAEPPASP